MNTTAIILLIGLIYISIQQKQESTRNMMLIITALLAFCMITKIEGFNVVIEATPYSADHHAWSDITNNELSFITSSCSSAGSSDSHSACSFNFPLHNNDTEVVDGIERGLTDQMALGCLSFNNCRIGATGDPASATWVAPVQNPPLYPGCHINIPQVTCDIGDSTDGVYTSTESGVVHWHNDIRRSVGTDSANYSNIHDLFDCIPQNESAAAVLTYCPSPSDLQVTGAHCSIDDVADADWPSGAVRHSGSVCSPGGRLEHEAICDLTCADGPASNDIQPICLDGTINMRTFACPEQIVNPGTGAQGTCTEPSLPTNVIQTPGPTQVLDIQTFNIDLQCDTGYSGNPVAVACDADQQAYTIENPVCNPDSVVSCTVPVQPGRLSSSDCTAGQTVDHDGICRLTCDGVTDLQSIPNRICQGGVFSPTFDSVNIDTYCGPDLGTGAGVQGTCTEPSPLPTNIIQTPGSTPVLDIPTFNIDLQCDTGYSGNPVAVVCDADQQDYTINNPVCTQIRSCETGFEDDNGTCVPSTCDNFSCPSQYSKLENPDTILKPTTGQLTAANCCESESTLRTRIGPGIIQTSLNNEACACGVIGTGSNDYMATESNIYCRYFDSDLDEDELWVTSENTLTNDYDDKGRKCGDGYWFDSKYCVTPRGSEPNRKNHGDPSGCEAQVEEEGFWAQVLGFFDFSI